MGERQKYDIKQNSFGIFASKDDRILESFLSFLNLQTGIIRGKKLKSWSDKQKKISNTG